jgi:hypothetical protein
MADRGYRFQLQLKARQLDELDGGKFPGIGRNATKNARARASYLRLCLPSLSATSKERGQLIPTMRPDRHRID